jgi:hypothetical protein
MRIHEYPITQQEKLSFLLIDVVNLLGLQTKLDTCIMFVSGAASSV